MSKITKAEDGSLVETETGITDALVDGALGILKFGKTDVHYDGNTVAAAEAIGLVGGMFLAAKMPQYNPFN